MALTQLKTSGIADDAVTTDKLANAINTERTANTAKVSLGADSVTGAKIADDAVGAEHIEQLDADLSFADDANASFGAGGDLKIDHNGTNSYVRNTTGILHVGGSGGNLILEAAGDVRTVTWTGESMIEAKQNGAVELYHDNSKKFETTSTGVKVDGGLIEIAHTSCHLDFMETSTTNHRLRNGSGNFYIQKISDDKNTTTDQLVIDGGTGVVDLYHNGTKKFSTTASGVDISTSSDNAIACSVTNNGTTGGHGIKISSGGTGSGTKLFEIESHNQSSAVQRFSVNADGWVHVGNVSSSSPAAVGDNGAAIGSVGFISANRESDLPMEIGRTGTDGDLVRFYHAGTEEGAIVISGTSVSYNGGTLSRWSQFKGLSQTDKSARPTIYQGTVLSNLDDLCVWEGEDNQQLNMTKISDSVGDKDVAGIFWAWDDDDKKILNDFYIAMTGDMVIRVAASTTVARGDLLISAGDGTAKPQADDIIRSSTIAKIISTNHTATYADGSKAYPCVLMAC